jgi:rhodanese-related sulfurtransferase
MRSARGAKGVNKIPRLAFSATLLFGVAVSFEAHAHNIEKRPSIMSARAAHVKALAGELVLVDIRTPDEWRKTGVPASGYAITMDQDQARFIRKLAVATGGSRQKPVALICARGNRSALLQGRLKQDGFKNVIDVAEGVIGGERGVGWINSGLPIRPWTPVR